MSAENRLMYFSIGDGGDAPREAYTVPVSRLHSIHPVDDTHLDLRFDLLIGQGYDNIRLTIVTDTHKVVTNAINDAIQNQGRSMILICDKDNSSFVDSNITDCVIDTVSYGVLYKNKITSATTVEIINVNEKFEKLTSMTLTNVHTGAATVQVYLLDQDPGTLYYIIKDVVIPVGSTLKLESDELDYDASIFNLYVKLGGSTPVDVIIR